MRDIIRKEVSCPMGFPGSSDGKESACSAGDLEFDPWVGKIPWRSKRLPTPVFLPGKSHGQTSLVGYSPRGHKELDMTERLTQTHILSHGSVLMKNRYVVNGSF